MLKDLCFVNYDSSLEFTGIFYPLGSNIDLLNLAYSLFGSFHFFQLGVVLLEQGKASQALAYLDKALELEPEHEQALLNSAILLQELGAADLRVLARQRLLKLLDKDGK